MGWETPWNVDLSLTWRYYAAVTNMFPATAGNIDYKLGSRSYFDLAANWAVTEKASVLLGINNVLDKDPPITSAVGTTGNGNTFPQTYDATGPLDLPARPGRILIAPENWKLAAASQRGRRFFLAVFFFSSWARRRIRPCGFRAGTDRSSGACDAAARDAARIPRSRRSR